MQKAALYPAVRLLTYSIYLKKETFTPDGIKLLPL